jgi:hypothetical protein
MMETTAPEQKPGAVNFCGLLRSLDPAVKELDGAGHRGAEVVRVKLLQIVTAARVELDREQVDAVM